MTNALAKIVLLLTIVCIIIFMFPISIQDEDAYSEVQNIEDSVNNIHHAAQGSADITPEKQNKSTTTDKNTVRLSFAGDVIFEKAIDRLIKDKGLSYLFDEVRPVFEASDIAMVNLETPVSNSGVKETDKQYTFRAAPDSLNGLKNASGINIVSLANNHVLDYGRDALTDTFHFLEREGVKKAGAGENLEEASMPLYIDVKGHKIAIIAASRIIPYVRWYATADESGVAATYNTKIIKVVIAKARKNADMVVVYVHWGKEKSEVPDKVQTELARTYIDNGADLVVGAHPHVLQGIEIYKGKLIAYSLGNFLFTDRKRDSMILSITVENKKITGASIIPCEIRNFIPYIIKEKEKLDVYYENMRRLSDVISKNISIDKDGNIKLPIM